MDEFFAKSTCPSSQTFLCGFDCKYWFSMIIKFPIALLKDNLKAQVTKNKILLFWICTCLGVAKDCWCWLVRQVLLGYGGKFRNHPMQNQVQGIWGEISILESKCLFQILYVTVVLEFVHCSCKHQRMQLYLSFKVFTSQLWVNLFD